MNSIYVSLKQPLHAALWWGISKTILSYYANTFLYWVSEKKIMYRNKLFFSVQDDHWFWEGFEFPLCHSREFWDEKFVGIFTCRIWRSLEPSPGVSQMADEDDMISLSATKHNKKNRINIFLVCNFYFYKTYAMKPKVVDCTNIMLYCIQHERKYLCNKKTMKNK